MTFTKEQMEILSSFEENFRTALQSNYSRGIGSSGYTTMHRILKEATGKNLPFRPSCYSCMFRLVSTTGKLYMADKQEIVRQEEERKRQVKMQQEAEAKKVKVEVKTKAKSKTKSKSKAKKSAE